MQDTLEIKRQMKNAIIEVFEEDNELLRNLITDLMEEIALAKAIEEGDKEDYIDEKIILAQLTKAI